VTLSRRQFLLQPEAATRHREPRCSPHPPRPAGCSPGQGELL